MKAKTPVSQRLTPGHWASPIPFGLTHQHPNNFAEVFRAVGENRDALGHAWRILRDGVCDGCALGTSGLSDWTLEGIHLCNIRLRLLRLNTMGALDTGVLSDVHALMPEGRLPRARDLREMGRLPYPMLRRRGEPGFTRVGWDRALDLVADQIRASSPERLGFYLTSRGIPNEVYYGVQKAVRALGTNSVDNAARLCHSPSTSGLKAGLGVAATTCSYRDWLDADLVVFFGSNVANNQPVATKYLHYAKKAGTKVACVNSYREPGMDKYWIPSIPESAVFGTQITDRFFLINIDGDIAFLNGVLKIMIAEEWLDPAFVEKHTSGFGELTTHLDGLDMEILEAQAGVDRGEMRAFATMIRDAERAVFVWSMGITQHETGAQGVMSIINLALTKGFVGRTGCGLMPIRGHSGVQGGAEMGAYSTVFPGGAPVNVENARALSKQYGFDVADAPGMTAPQMIDAAHAGALDLLFAIGGNFLQVLPEPNYVEEALGRVPLRVHMDIVLSPQMFLEPADTVLLLPATTRYEIPGGVTQTSTERRVIFSPEIPGPRIGEARPESEVVLEIARRVRPKLAEKLTFAGTAEIREEIGRVIPYYNGVQHLRRKGDHFQYGGPHLCAGWEFPTPDGRARFSAVSPPENDVPDGMFALTTRRGKQFNSIIHEQKDSLNGTVRDAVLINERDIRALGLRAGARVRLSNEIGAMEGHLVPAPVTPGNLQVHWPEGNVLIRRGCRSPEAGIPDYNGAVRVEPL